jgi:5-methylcytosine-specific restriction endonuclease McrA
MLARLQEGLCAYCYRPMLPARPPGSQSGLSCTLEEVVPWANGGRHVMNTVAACYRCNFAKKCRLPTGCELIALAWVSARFRADPVARARFSDG